jgi:ketosteroid isomerase-like protein
MTRVRRIGFAILLSLSFVASVSAAIAGPREIAEASAAQWNEAFRSGRIEDILSLYADNAILLQPSGQVSRTPKEIRAFWEGLIERKGGEYRIHVVDARVEKDGSIVTSLRFSRQQHPTRSGRTMNYNYDGELLSVFKRQPDGTWKAQVQRWT